MQKTIPELPSVTPSHVDRLLLVDTSDNNTAKQNTIQAVLAALGIPGDVVASLGAATTANKIKYALNGRKIGEGSGAGTGVLVTSDGSNWIAADSGAAVAA